MPVRQEATETAIPWRRAGWDNARTQVLRGGQDRLRWPQRELGVRRAIRMFGLGRQTDRASLYGAATYGAEERRPWVVRDAISGEGPGVPSEGRACDGRDRRRSFDACSIAGPPVHPACPAFVGRGRQRADAEPEAGSALEFFLKRSLSCSRNNIASETYSMCRCHPVQLRFS